MGLNWNEIKSRALLFSQTWADACNEKSQSSHFWIDFMGIFGIPNKRMVSFEHNVQKLNGAKGYVDLFWPGKLLVEQKSLGKDLKDATQQAMDYLHGIKDHELPELIVVCDFQNFEVRPLKGGEVLRFKLKDLHKHVKHFGTLLGYKVQTIRPEDPVNIKAAMALGRLHDTLKASGYQGHALEVLLVRMLFCLFADDTGIFQPTDSFRDFIEERTAPDGSDLGPRLGQLFQVLNTAETQRSKHLDEQLAKFAYINGRLFEETLPMADFNTAMRQALLDACALDWSTISPAIFGSLFQSIMDEKARRNLGAHYTSEANILKLIKPLFLDELHAEFERIRGNRHKLEAFHRRLKTLTFLDPACGCGNFLVISYRELRELELQVLRAANELSDHKGQQSVDVNSLIGVNVDQFYGIEIEEFPAQIAQVALWLVDHQMNLRVSEEFGLYYARIPLRNSPHIRHANALRLDWNEVLPAERCGFVMGNPPFLGKTYQSKDQKADLAAVMHGLHGAGDLDFVCCWYVLAAKYLGLNQQAHAAFVSTNSITQGEQVAVLWGEMQRLGMHIHFAHRTFQWSNEASGKAAVHCVIVGFGPQDQVVKTIYEYEDIKGLPHAVQVKRINAYLVDAPEVFLNKRSTPIKKVPAMANGGKPTDGGNLLMNDEEKAALLVIEPQAAKWIRPYLMGDEFINNIGRWCLWLVNIPPAELRAMPHVLKRVEGVRAMREASTKPATVELASTPTLFGEIRQPKSPRYLAIPKVSSERRQYIPIGYLDNQVICGDKIFFIDDASLFTFGVLTSTMHNAWMRQTCGRLESRYSYSNTIVYNNFPWPGFAGDPLSDKHRNAIEQAAQAVLDARAAFPTSSLADLYDPLTMPPALLKAHHKLDTAVDAAYQPSGGKKSYASDAERVAFLFELYQRITSLLPAAAAKKTRKTKVTES
jgi:type II restriction/modification system DNA methylase subunit YeeA